MSDQMTLAVDGPTRKARGQARVDSNADPAWVAAVDEIIVELADIGQPFNANTVRYVADLRGVHPPHHPNAWSARFSAAAKRRVITKTGRYVQALRPERHSAVIAEWRGSWTA